MPSVVHLGHVICIMCACAEKCIHNFNNTLQYHTLNHLLIQLLSIWWTHFRKL